LQLSGGTSTGAGDWENAKVALRNKDCCIVSVTGLEHQLKVLQDVLADNGPSEIDLRARIHVRPSVSSSSSTSGSTYNDCVRVRNSVVPFLEGNEENGGSEIVDIDPCSAALKELACGMFSLADGPFESVVNDVFVRIVCASDYKGKDPPFHTDKAPLRGYVTLRGVGTEFMTRPCRPIEYMTLRTFGRPEDYESGERKRGGAQRREPTKSLRMADELEFIVMKGDYYEHPTEKDSSTSLSSSSSLISKAGWKRESACVHRSPPGKGGRRVIVSFDLADGDDDREWYQVGLKREWRSGMTQRKSHLVA
jgi:Protein of unknown function (DUF1826)